jgi:hypothetical protein
MQQMSPAQSESGGFKDSARCPRRLLKIGTKNARQALRISISGAVRHDCHGIRRYHNAGIRSELTGFVLNVPLSSAICG